MGPRGEVLGRSVVATAAKIVLQGPSFFCLFLCRSSAGGEVDGFDAAIASKDPLQLCVQVLLVKARAASVFKKTKLQAIHMLKALIRPQEHRRRLVDMVRSFNGLHFPLTRL